MKYYLYLCTLVETRDYTVGGPKLEVHNLLTLEIVHFQLRSPNYIVSCLYHCAKVRMVFHRSINLVLIGTCVFSSQIAGGGHQKIIGPSLNDPPGVS